jgi:hypothetical protein
VREGVCGRRELEKKSPAHLVHPFGHSLPVTLTSTPTRTLAHSRQTHTTLTYSFRSRALPHALPNNHSPNPFRMHSHKHSRQTHTTLTYSLRSSALPGQQKLAHVLRSTLPHPPTHSLSTHTHILLPNPAKLTNTLTCTLKQALLSRSLSQAHSHAL